MHGKTDSGDGIKVKNAQWKFSDAVDKFDTHIRKSVPLYDLGHEHVANLAAFFMRDGARVYEIGCSTGELSSKVLAHNPDKKIEYIAIDAVEEMVKKAQKKLESDSRAKILLADAVKHEYKPCSLVLSYYTIQFIEPCVRQELINKIYDSLEWGGAAIIYEKVRGPDARFQDLLTQLYTDYKLKQGFTESEIVHKTRSLKGVLEPFSTEGNLGLLKRAGFVDIMTIQKYLCFEGYLCIK